MHIFSGCLFALLPDAWYSTENALLIVASLLFYAYGEPKFVLLMIFSAAFNYLFARMIGGCRINE